MWLVVAGFAGLSVVALAGAGAHADGVRAPSMSAAVQPLPVGSPGIPDLGASDLDASDAGASRAEAAAPAAAPGGAAPVDPGWASATATRTAVPLRALIAYAGASLALQSEQPGCRLGWTTLAAIGATESGHGTHGSSALGTDGTARPPIVGAALDGGAYDAIGDSDGGAADGDTRWDRALGPFQFIPDTWREWGADADGDGIAEVQDIDDAALAAGRYLCHYGDLAQPAAWRQAVFAYNHDESYVDSIAVEANALAALAG